jgi:hypothetical protein
MVIIGIILLYVFITYLIYPEQPIIKDSTISYLNYLDEPYSIVSLSIFLIFLYVLLFLFAVILANDKSIIISLVENLAWITLALILIVDFFKYVLEIDIITLVKEVLFGETKKLVVDTSNNIVDASTMKNEVFHISNNIYTYDDAQAVCSSYGATLANYNQLNDYYANGGEFCGYGWSTDQMALFPTQEKTWEKLQKNTKNKNVCGRPGINGGVFDSSYKFGVNCYGKKPAPTADQLSCVNNNTIPKTAEDVAIEEKIKYYKENADKLMNISSFNYEKWNQ